MPTIDPGMLKPLKPIIIVKQYRRPEEHGSLVLPKSYEDDKSMQLWEAVRCNFEAAEELGYYVSEGSIIKTRTTWPADTGFDDERDGRKLFFLPAEQVLHVTHNTWEDDGD